MADFYHTRPDLREARIGQMIYQAALHGRKDFRPEHVGIPIEDDVWIEIFTEIGRQALFAVSSH